MEDTFYLRPSAARARPASPTLSDDDEEQVAAHPPPALANAARFAHLYDDPIAKPPVPPSARAPSPQHSGEDFGTSGLDRSRSNSATPEPSTASVTPAPSPARRVFNYLGALVGRPA